MADKGSLPASRGITEFRLEDMMACHAQEAGVDLSRLALAHPVHRRLRSTIVLEPMANKVSLS